MKKILLALLAAGCFLPAYSQTYYQKVPKLVPAGDGTYRILEGEYEYVPVNEQGYANPVIVGQENTHQQDAALADEAARWARGESTTTPKPAAPQKPQTVPTPKEKPVPQNKTSLATTNRPYVSIGGGDHFNAGLVFALENGFSLEESLYIASAVSGSYVRTGAAPTLLDLVRFLTRSLNAD